MVKKVAVIGNSADAAQCALALAQMGAEANIITDSISLDLAGNVTSQTTAPKESQLCIWPLLLRAASHPRVKLYSNSRLETINEKRGGFTLRAKRLPRYVNEKLCTSCGRCQEVCAVKLISSREGHTIAHRAIHPPLASTRAVPTAYSIDKKGVAACKIACPLGINIPGFICLLSEGKTDEALSLINEAAPLAGVLGRVCTHPCESNCQRAQVDSPVFIQALHRYAADNGSRNVNYSHKRPAKSKVDKIAIVGSGPSGLTAAWKLAQRGYTPTIFESHAVIGGMMATGIPRFRLSHEVREREVESILAMGVDMKTGVTVGRDITLPDLREQDYKAFYLAIGAGLNNKLNIPGEDLKGVFDVISMLFALNLKVGTPIGSNVAVIGGGNSALDAARAVKRRSKGKVRILYRRSEEEITAIKEHVQEAIEEGVLIEYLTLPIEIIGDGTKVTGIRCQRMALGKIGADGRRIPTPIEGSDFIIDADHVVIAAGQRPSTSLLKIKDLKINDDTTINVDPLTLQTNIPDIFAGGDCITGPNNVVAAMANGLRAAESIDRYLKGHDLRKGRSLEKPNPAEVDVKERYVSPKKRAKMPTLTRNERKDNFEEITKGLPADVARAEASRCLNCALCSGCRECERICQVNAVNHKDAAKSFEIKADAVVNFISDSNAPVNFTPQPSSQDIFTIVAKNNHSLWSRLSQASAVALELAQRLKLRRNRDIDSNDTSNDGNIYLHCKPQLKEQAYAGKKSTGVVLCRCGNSISSVIDFTAVTNEIKHISGVSDIQELDQVCTEHGAQQIKDIATKGKLDRLVIAACRCCNLDQICFSCTQQRVRCKQYLNQSLKSNGGISIEFVNIREQCAWVHSKSPIEATRKAIDIIRTGIIQAQNALPAIPKEYPIHESVLVIGDGLASLSAAEGLASLAYPITLACKLEPSGIKKQRASEYYKKETALLSLLKKRGVSIMTQPQIMEIYGAPGNYEAVLKYNSKLTNIRAGAIVLDPNGIDESSEQANTVFNGNLVGRILARYNCYRDESPQDCTTIQRIMDGGDTGIFIMPSDKTSSANEQIVNGRAAAAMVLSFVSQEAIKLRANAITINDQLCRGCGDCAVLCPYIEVKVNNSGVKYAHIDPALCLGCGVCLACCPTGAITQPIYDDLSITSRIEALLGKTMLGDNHWQQAGGEIIVFTCNWDGLSCIEAAGQNHLSYSPAVKVVRVSCLSRIHSGLILKAFQLGVGGVMLLGCKSDSCRFSNSSKYIINREYDKAREILGLLGFKKERLKLIRLAQGDGAGFVKHVTSFASGLEQLQLLQTGQKHSERCTIQSTTTGEIISKI